MLILLAAEANDCSYSNDMDGEADEANEKIYKKFTLCNLHRHKVFVSPFAVSAMPPPN